MDYSQIETEQQYNQAIARYQQIKNATTGADYKEKLLLVRQIESYEKGIRDLPEMSEVEMEKIRKDDFEYPASGLLDETQYITASEVNRKRLQEAIDEMNSGIYLKNTLIEL